MPSLTRRTVWEFLQTAEDTGSDEFGQIRRPRRLTRQVAIPLHYAMDLVRPGAGASRQKRLEACKLALELSEETQWTEDASVRTSFERILDDCDPWDRPVKVQKPIPEALKCTPTPKFSSALGVASASDILKELYTQQNIESLTYTSPFVAAMGQQFVAAMGQQMGQQMDQQMAQQSQGSLAQPIGTTQAGNEIFGQSLAQSQNSYQAQMAWQNQGVWQQNGNGNYEAHVNVPLSYAGAPLRELMTQLVGALDTFLAPTPGTSVSMGDLDTILSRATLVRDLAAQWLGNAP